MGANIIIICSFIAEEPEYFVFKSLDANVTYRFTKVFSLDQLPYETTEQTPGGLQKYLLLPCATAPPAPPPAAPQESLSEPLWTDSATRVLIAEYGLKSELVVQRKLRSLEKMWQVIQGIFGAHGNKTGRGRKTCPYETELEALLGNKDKFVPQVLRGPGICQTLSAEGPRIQSDEQDVNQQLLSCPSTSSTSSSTSGCSQSQSPSVVQPQSDSTSSASTPGSIQEDLGNPSRKRSRASIISVLEKARISMEERHRRIVELHEAKVVARKQRHTEKMEMMAKI